MSGSRLFLLVVYAALWAVGITAPPGPDPLMPSLVAMLTLSGPDPWTAACFGLMGLWPMLYAGILLLDGPGQRLPAWPFVLGAFAGGMFVLTPYLLLRRPGQPPKQDGLLVGLAGHPGLGAIVLLGTVGLVSFAAFTGSPADLARGVVEDGFVRTFMADFVAFWLGTFVLLSDDVRRFDAPRARVGWAAIPLLGPALHLLTRQRG